MRSSSSRACASLQRAHESSGPARSQDAPRGGPLPMRRESNRAGRILWRSAGRTPRKGKSGAGPNRSAPRPRAGARLPQGFGGAPVPGQPFMLRLPAASADGRIASDRNPISPAVHVMGGRYSNRYVHFGVLHRPVTMSKPSPAGEKDAYGHPRVPHLFRQGSMDAAHTARRGNYFIPFISSRFFGSVTISSARVRTAAGEEGDRPTDGFAPARASLDLEAVGGHSQRPGSRMQGRPSTPPVPGAGTIRPK